MDEYNYKNVYSNSEKKTNPIKKEHPTSKLQVPRDKKLRKKKSAQSTYYIGQKMKNYRVSKRLATIKDKDKRSKSDEIVKLKLSEMNRRDWAWYPALYTRPWPLQRPPSQVNLRRWNQVCFEGWRVGISFYMELIVV